MLQFVTAMAALLCLAWGVVAIVQWRREAAAEETRVRLSELTAGAERQSERNGIAVFISDVENLLPRWISRRLFQAGIEIDTRRLSFAVFIIAGIWIALIVMFGFLVASIGSIALVGGGLGVLDYAASRRMDALSLAMSGFLDRIRQLLVVGNSLSVALARATQSSPPIVVEFLSPTIRRIANGAGVGESVNQLADELDLHEMRLFGAAIETNLRFGGSLTAVLANLIENMRRRAAVDREVRANTSQIRASAWILGLLPVGASALVMITNPEYAEYFIYDPTGHKMLFYAAMSEAIGAFLMRAVVRVAY